MPEDNPKNVKKEFSEKEITEAKEMAKRCFSRVRPLLETFSKERGLKFELGEYEASCFLPEEGVIRLGWAYFLDKRADELTAAAALFHELGHLEHLLLNPTVTMNIYEEMSAKPEIHLLYNACDDIQIEEGLKRFPPIRKEREVTYRSTAVLRQPPKTLSAQFTLGLMEYAMFGEVPQWLDEKVKKAIGEVTNIGDVNAVDVLKTTPEPEMRYPLIRSVFQPIFERFLKEEENKQNVFQEIQQLMQMLQNGSAMSIKVGTGKEKAGEKPNEPQIEMPFNLSKEDIEKILRFFKEKESEKSTDVGDVERKAAGMTAAAHNITVNEAADYGYDYDMVKEYVKRVADELEKIVEEQIEKVMGLSNPSRRGVIIEPGLIHQAYVAIKTGQEAAVFRRPEPIRKVRREYPTEVVFYLLADMSASMSGEPEECQRKTVVLLMEGIKEYESRLKERRRKLGRYDVGFDVKCEIRRFGSQDIPLKSADRELDIKSRVEVHKRLFNADEGATREDLSLNEILDKIDSLPKDEKEKIKSGEKKHIVMVLSDGMSGNPKKTKRIVSELRADGVEVWGIGIKSQEIVDLLAPYGKPIYDPRDLPTVISEFIVECIKKARKTVG